MSAWLGGLGPVEMWAGMQIMVGCCLGGEVVFVVVSRLAGSVE